MPASTSVQILMTHTPALFAAAVSRAVELLKAGEVVALPTETVYGLAANALDRDAVAKIYAIKGRPAHNPIIVHVSSLEMARRCAAEWPESADRMASAFWPGPLTLVLPRSESIPEIVTAGGPTVGIRWPGHPFIKAVIRECGFPLAAPSANLSNCISPTNAGHVARQLGTQLPLIVDGGQAQVGIESTVVDLSTTPARVLRPGMIHDESLRSVLGELGFPGNEDLGALRSPGLLKKHYSPRAKLKILSWRDDADLRSRVEPDVMHATHVLAHSLIPSPEGFARVSVIPHDAEAFARALYAELHHCDELGAKLIIVEALSDAPEWQGIADRLNRAAAA